MTRTNASFTVELVEALIARAERLFDKCRVRGDHVLVAGLSGACIAAEAHIHMWEITGNASYVQSLNAANDFEKLLEHIFLVEGRLELNVSNQQCSNSSHFSRAEL